MSEYQEEVLTNILDLQAELRGDEPPASDGPESEPEAAAEEASPETVAVSEEGVTVSVAGPSSGLAVNDRLAALNERLARLEYDLAGVTKRIEKIEPAPETQPADTDVDADAPWRSFLDLQKIVADRLDDR